MSDERMAWCGKCGKSHTSRQLDPDDFDVELEDLGWIVPDEGMRFEGGIYRCPECQPNVSGDTKDGN